MRISFYILVRGPHRMMIHDTPCNMWTHSGFMVGGDVEEMIQKLEPMVDEAGKKECRHSASMNYFMDTTFRQNRMLHAMHWLKVF